MATTVPLRSVSRAYHYDCFLSRISPIQSAKLVRMAYVVHIWKVRMGMRDGLVPMGV
jgi:hypothetical protein